MASLLNPGRFFNRDNYPQLLGPKRIGGSVVMLLSVDAAGKITHCLPINKPDEALGKATCAIALTRLRARPAMNADGKAMDGYAFLPVRWLP